MWIDECIETSWYEGISILLNWPSILNSITFVSAIVIDGIVIGTGAAIVFTFYSIHCAITPGSASRTNSHSLAGVAENATWRDIGAAIGTLSGGFVISSSHLNEVLQFGIAAMTILLLVHLGGMELIFKRVFSWK